MSSIKDELIAAGDRASVETADRQDKKNYAERLSRELAKRFANQLRAEFDGIIPDQHGAGQESRARSSKGYKRLDVNYSTVELGLGLGVSIKTINFPDGRTRRFTKNYTRVDSELRAEASDYHERQPFAVMIALIFLPATSCEDGSSRSASSFGSAVQLFRFRSGRGHPTDHAMLFEGVFIGLYTVDDENFGDVSFFDVTRTPPKRGYPEDTLTIGELCEEITKIYDRRNRPMFTWADSDAEPASLPSAASEEEDLG